MPKQPVKRHVLAEVRIKCGLTQRELGKLLGVAMITIQRIEQGTLALSEDLATKAERELNVSAAWLLANDAKKPAVTRSGRGLWTKEFYEFAQGTSPVIFREKQPGETFVHHRHGAAVPKGSADQFIAWRSTSYLARIRAMLDGARDSPSQGILIHRLDKMIAKLEEDFQPAPETLDRYTPQIRKLEKAFLMTVRQISQRESDELSGSRAKPCPGEILP